MRVGRISELWRYPVKSMRGDRVPSATVTEQWGVPGDRGWALRDEDASEIRGAKRLPSLLQFHARYLDEPRSGSTPAAEITFPNGSVMRSDDASIHRTLSDAVGREVTLWPRQTAQAHYATPRGTYFDAFPLSLLTTTALDSLQATVPDSLIDPRRFRKNIILETPSTPTIPPTPSDPPAPEGSAVGGSGDASYPEFDWVGRHLAIGEVVCEVVMPISRCVMVGLPQAELPHDRAILESLARNSGTDLGVYLRVITPGTVNEGDPVSLQSPNGASS